MDQNEKIGSLISTRRKIMELTQKDLADCLGVTDKAVSKWERGISYPDISLLVSLADMLGISVEELLKGEENITIPAAGDDFEKLNTYIDDVNVASDRFEDREESKPEAIPFSVNEALIKQKRRYNVEKIRLIFYLFSAACLLGIITCAIVDFAVTDNLGWSLIVILSIVTSWLVLLPFSKDLNKALLRAGAVFSLLLIPFLGVLSLLIKEPMVFTFGKWIAPVGIAWLWCTYSIFKKIPISKIQATGISLIITVPVQWYINYQIDRLLSSRTQKWSYALNTIVLLALAVACLGSQSIKKQMDKARKIRLSK